MLGLRLVRETLRLRWLVLLVHVVVCSPPENPINCASGTTKCTITNSYGAFPDRTICKAAEVVYPTSEEELVQAVAEAATSKRKMKVATRYSHSIPKLACPAGDDGLIISTRNLNHVVSVNFLTMMMTVESGVTLKGLIEAAAKAGLALPHSPYWLGLTIGGLMATGAHGSSLRGKGSAVHEYVVGIRIVTPASKNEGFAVVRSLDPSQPDFDAAKVSLGVLGVISQVTFKLQPLFKRSIAYLASSDADLAEKAASFGHQHEFADITWLPGQRKALYRVDDRVSSNVTGDGRNDFLGFRPTLAVVLGVNRAAEESAEAIKSAETKCVNSKIITNTLATAGYGLENNGILFTGYPVVGFQNQMQSSGSCLDSKDDGLITTCPWDPRVNATYFHQTTFSIALSKVKDFIIDVQKLRDKDPKALCGVELYNGILMRYVKASSAYLGKEEDGLDFDFTYYRSKDPMEPRLYEDVLEEIEQMGLFKYDGLPHWGKNRNIAFDRVISKYAKAGEFIKVKNRYDSDGLFSSDWSDQLLGIKGSTSIFKEGCALEGLCICSEDSHCAPAKGYLCRPGKVYKDARVCTRLNTK